MSNIIAVGLDVSLDVSYIKTVLESVITSEELSKYIIPESQKAGFMYGESCHVGKWTGLTFSQDELLKWYTRHKGTILSAYFTRLYKTPHILLLEGTLNGKYFSFVLSNMTKGIQTFLHKKNANSGLYGAPITIPRIEIKGIPYIYYDEKK